MPENPYLWHGVLMMLAWWGLFPIGILGARFFKVTPGQDFPHKLDNQFWWHLHRFCQYAGLLIATAAVWLIWQVQGGELTLEQWHGQMGIAAVGLAWLQAIGAWLRGTKGGPTDTLAVPGDPTTWRGDHYDMTPRRRVFESWHKRFGYVALALAWTNIALGLPLLGIPAVWAAVPPVFYAGLFVWLQWQGRQIDTWEAIWGPRDASMERSPPREVER